MTDRPVPDGPPGERPADPLAAQLADVLPRVMDQLGAVNEARETALPACRQVIRASSRAIRAVHRGQGDVAAGLTDQAEAALRKAQETVGPHPEVAFAGFLHDAEKEYVEAVCVGRLVAGAPLPGAGELRVGLPAWLNGLAEAASEMRRHMLDLLRAGDLDRARSVLGTVDDVYDFLLAIDYPDALTGGLRRTTDALRAVLERSRSDLTTTALQTRLQRAIEGGASAGG